MKLFFKTSGVVAIIAICTILGHIVYLWATYIDETATSGESYGFKIGETKEEVFRKTGDLFKDKKVYFLHPLGKNNHGPHKELRYSSEDYEIIKERNKWDLYFTEGFFDSIKLTFEKDRLTEIHRHRKKFELP